MNKNEIIFTHLTCREYNDFFYVNCVFKSHNNSLSYYANDGFYTAAMDTKEDYDAYNESLSLSFDENHRMSLSSSYHKRPYTVYILDIDPLLDHIEKFDSYVFRGYFEKTLVVEAAIQMLKDFYNNFRDPIEGFTLISVLRSLSASWH